MLPSCRPPRELLFVNEFILAECTQRNIQFQFQRKDAGLRIEHTGSLRRYTQRALLLIDIDYVMIRNCYFPGAGIKPQVQRCSLDRPEIVNDNALRLVRVNGNGYRLGDRRIVSFSFFDDPIKGFGDTAVLIRDYEAPVERAIVVNDLDSGSRVQTVRSGKSDGIVGVANGNDGEFYNLFTIHEGIILWRKLYCTGIFAPWNGQCSFIFDGIKVDGGVIRCNRVLNRNGSERSDTADVHDYRHFALLLASNHLPFLKMHKLASLVLRWLIRITRRHHHHKGQDTCFTPVNYRSINSHRNQDSEPCLHSLRIPPGEWAT